MLRTRPHGLFVTFGLRGSFINLFFKEFLNNIYFSFHYAARSSGNKDMKGGFFKQDCSSLPLALKAPPFKKFCRTNVPMAQFESFSPFRTIVWVIKRYLSDIYKEIFQTATIIVQLHTANIFDVIFTVFNCVRLSTVISLYGLHLIAAPSTTE